MTAEAPLVAVVVPVYNEGPRVAGVLDAVRRVFAGPLVVIDDGSVDETPAVLSARDDVHVVTHGVNQGYGASLIGGFAVCVRLGAESVITMDCDGQHEPGHIPGFAAALEGLGADIVSGSRYLDDSPALGVAPAQRRSVNERVTAAVNGVTGWGITDAFCGFKAYRTASLAQLRLSEPGYAMPLQLWAEAHRARLRVRELPIERIYFDGDRSFGQDLDDPDRRLAYYLDVWERSVGEAG